MSSVEVADISRLMPDHPFNSRDHALSGIVRCAVKCCPANDEAGRCNMPSCIEIAADGTCELGRKAREDKAAQAQAVHEQEGRARREINMLMPPNEYPDDYPMEQK